MEMVSAMLIHSKLPMGYWGEALLSSCYISNRIVSKKHMKTPYELFTGHVPSIKHLRVWGCIAYVLDATLKRPKLGSKAVKFVFIGYSAMSKAYIFLKLHDNSVFEATHAIFYEHLNIRDADKIEINNDLFVELETDEHASNHEIVNNDNFEENENDKNLEENKEKNEIIKLRRSKRRRFEKNFGPDMMTYMLDEGSKNFSRSYVTTRF